MIMLYFNSNEWVEISEKELEEEQENYFIAFSDIENGYINCDTSDYGTTDGDLISIEYINDNDMVFCEDTQDYQFNDYAVYLEDEDYYVTRDSEDYYECDDCHRYFSRDYYMHEIHDNYYCDDCVDEHRGYIYDYHEYDGRYVPRRLGNEPKLFLGFELEVDDCNIDCETVASNVLDCDSDNVLHCEYDCSVDFEFISQPCTLEYHKNQDYKSWMFDNLIGNCLSHDSGTCGLHVHVNKDYFDDKGYGRLKTILFFFKEELFKFSRRSDWNNHYANFDEIIPKDKVTIEKAKSLKKYGHNTWFNESGETFEFRFFRGTLKFGTFMASLELVRNICALAQSNWDTIEWNDLVVGDYCKDYSESRNIECSDVLNLDKLEKAEAERYINVKHELQTYAFVKRYNIVTAEIVDSTVFFYTVCGYHDGTVEKVKYSEYTLDELLDGGLLENGFVRLCDRESLVKALGGIL